jgi:hypothetical protein
MVTSLTAYPSPACDGVALVTGGGDPLHLVLHFDDK